MFKLNCVGFGYEEFKDLLMDINWIRRIVSRAGVSCWIISIIIFSSSLYKNPSDLFSAFAFSAFFAFPAYVLIGFPWAMDRDD